jgi:hypothetical protein
MGAARLVPRAVLGAVLYALAVPTPERLEFRPAVGSALRKTFREVTALELDSARERVGGEERELAGLELALENERELVVADEYAALGERRPERLRRRFERCVTLGAVERSGDREERGATRGSSPLAGRVVRFAFDADADAFAVAFDDERGGDDDLLGGLREDADLRALLPADDVAAGASWELALDALAGVLDPCGDLSLAVDAPVALAKTLLPCHLSSLAEVARGELAGAVRCEYRGSVRRDGRTLALVALELEGRARRDASGELRRLAGALGVDAEDVARLSGCVLRTELEGEGEVLWDGEAGRVHGLALELAVELELELREERDGEDRSVMLAFAGRSKLRLEVEEP